MIVSLLSRACFTPVIAASAAFVLLSGCTKTTQPIMATEQAQGREQPREFTPQAMLHLADTLRQSGDYMGAFRVYQQLRDREPQNVEAAIGQAETFLALGAAPEAERRFKAVLTQTPEDPRVTAGLARSLTRLGRADEALPFFQKAAASGYESPEFFNHYGVALDLAGQHVDAQQQYGLGLDRKPNDPSLVNNLALSYALSDAYPTAVRLLSELVTAFPGAEGAKRNLVTVYGLSGDFDAAESLAKVDQSPEETHNQLIVVRHIAALPQDQRAKALFLGLDSLKATPPSSLQSAQVPEQTFGSSAVASDRIVAEPLGGEDATVVDVDVHPGTSSEDTTTVAEGEKGAEEEAGLKPDAHKVSQPTTGVPLELPKKERVVPVLPATTPPPDTEKTPPAPAPAPAPAPIKPSEENTAATAQAAPGLPATASQLASYPSRSQAELGWSKLQVKAPDLLANAQPIYWESDGYVRLLIAAPNGLAEARSFCVTAVAAGLDCLPRRVGP